MEGETVEGEIMDENIGLGEKKKEKQNPKFYLKGFSEWISQNKKPEIIVAIFCSLIPLFLGLMVWIVGEKTHWIWKTIFSIIFVSLWTFIILKYFPLSVSTDGIGFSRGLFLRVIISYAPIILAIICVIIIVILVVIFYLVVPPEQTDPPIDYPSVTMAVTPTLRHIPTFTPTSTSTPTLTPTPTPTLIPTSTPIYQDLSIGLFDLGEGCFKQEIYEKLIELGFMVDKINFDIEYQKLLAYDVLYLSSGWSCKTEEIQSIHIKLENYLHNNKGLLFGDPELEEESLVLSNPEEQFKGLLELPVHVEYRKLEEPEEYESYNTCLTSDINCQTHWIITDIDERDFPYPETVISFPTNRQYWVLTRGIKSRNPSLVIGSGNIKHFVLLAGGEFSSSDKNIGDELFTNIIIWLADKKPEEVNEWNPYVQ